MLVRLQPLPNREAQHQKAMTEPCKNAHKHTPQPEGYLQWHSWAAVKSRTHKQIRCPECGLFAIWVPKTPRKVKPVREG